ncbi:Acid phosphatase type 7 [Nymphon striatum]|nr:Acid phosphatase type 7 [Nymphon striatum]
MSPAITQQDLESHTRVNEAEDMMVTWTTLENPPTKSAVKYGFDEKSLTLSSEAKSTKFRAFYIHRAVISGVGQSKRVWYQCGSGNEWSNIASFKTRSLDTNSIVRIVLYGDLGIINGQSIPRIINDVENDMYDVIHHVGDIAYDMDVNNGSYGQIFLEMMEDASKQVPYMVSSGNHEVGLNYLDYKNQYTMPGDNQNMWYRKLLNQKTGRNIHGLSLWVIIPCIARQQTKMTTRVGVPFVHWLGMEPLLKEYGVDLAIWAHEHIYERMWPVYNLKVYNGSYSAPYTNPGAPTHIVTGSAGCQERHDDFKQVHPPYSAFRNADYGYTRMTVENTTHIHLQQVSDDKEGQIVDDFWLIREKHGPYPNL